MKKTIKTSPIFYMGNKKRLIQKGLIDMFPEKIETFYDMFGGSGVVSLNTKAEKYVLNELDNNIYNLYLVLKNNKPEKIINHIEKTIDDYGLPKINTNSTNTSAEVREYYKKNYMKFRSEYNISKNPLDLFVLMNYCLSQTVRFNQKGDFNMPFGNNRFIKEKHSQYYIDFYELVNKDNFKITNKSFDDFDILKFDSSDFVYLDPPYLNTTATYNENGKWTVQKQKKLLEFCEQLHKRNIKWAMSNVFENKEFTNTHLKEWVNLNNYNVYNFDGFSYHSCGKGDANTKEVLIINY